MQKFRESPCEGASNNRLINCFVFATIVLLSTPCVIATRSSYFLTTATPPPHRGAARQMYGSGSLRPPGNPMLAGQQRQFKQRIISSPPPNGYRRIPPPSQPYIYPFPIPLPDLKNLPISYPIFIGSDGKTFTISKSRNGGPIKVPPYLSHGRSSDRFPVDYGQVVGKGFSEDEVHVRKYPPFSPKTISHEHSLNVKYPEEDGAVVSPCGEDCEKNEFMCVRSCTCIKIEYRCDGEMDCEGEEDELECGEHDYHTKCEETENKIRCPRSGKCILKEWLCDGDDDCGDFSDETHCGAHANCTADQYECANGLCIPKIWLCDNDNDCKDFSDEQNCSRMGCTDDEFTCHDGSCISLSWKCDRQIDCSDGSDEINCDAESPVCLEGEFPCTYQKCIRIEYKCDGDNDCGDWSDEDDCQPTVSSCNPEQFRCTSGKCIPQQFRCDKQKDCENGEDESGCDPNMIRSCSPDEYTCNNGACILKTWLCDGAMDCSQGEDEQKCDVICDESKFLCKSPEINETMTSFCINKKHVCDGQRDCPRGEDEKDCPSKRNCETTSNCTQLCITRANGDFGCTCRAGYKLEDDGISCTDIDECAFETDPVCSQRCTNTLGSFTCGCMTGYVLRPDLRSCKALGGHPTLLFANRVDIRQVSLSNSKYTAILKGLHNAIALDYHYEKGLIFWSDIAIAVIRSAHINGSDVKDVIKWGSQMPTGVAVDWVHDLLFWTDSETRRIEVATLDGKQRAIIVANDLDKPRAIVIHPGDALVFWTDWGPAPKIERAEMDGGNRRSIVNESVFWPNGLTLDFTTNRIYWADAKHNVIETAFFDGTDRRKVISKGLPHPFALTIFEDALYWTDWHTKSISTANKATGVGLKILHSNLHFPMDIHSYHPQRQPKYKNHCGPSNGGCEHMCLPNKKSYSCVCRMGQKLKGDRKGCVKPEKLILFTRKKDIRIKHLDESGAHQHDMVIPFEGVKSAVGLAWDHINDTVYWTDVTQDTINRGNWNGSQQEILIQENLISPTGLAFDWLTHKIYWTDAEKAHIEVANSDGTMRNLLLWDNINRPQDIVVDPLGGFLYWSDWGDPSRIEKAAMDGTGRQVLIRQNISLPNGLAVDHDAGKLYWADGGTKTIEVANLDGTGRYSLLGADLPYPFSLDIYANRIYWSDWTTQTIETADKTTGANRSVILSTKDNLMEIKVFHRSRKIKKTPCNNKNGGCSHLCLLKPNGYSCACTTGITLQDDGKTCLSGPKNYLILAHRMDIRQISLDVPYTADIVLPLPKLKKATSVDVDRKTGEIYWTDTTEDVIKRGTADGNNIKTIVKHELVMPDGLAIDSTGRKMYWTDGERNSIEVAELDGKNRKVLIWTDLDNPRAIALHYHLGLMFWSDWGKQAKIESAHMDGTNRKTLISEKVVWPNGLTIDRPAQRLYWNDGKLSRIESSDLDGKNRKVIITNAPHPYGLVVVGNHIYWTDWETQALHRADKLNGSDSVVIRGKLSGLMDVRSVQSDNIAENACGTNNGGCSHLCLRNPTSFTCACPTGLRMAKGSKKVCETHPSTYLLVAARYSLVRISLDTDDYWDVSLPIEAVDRVTDVDFHYEKQLFFFTDIERHLIQCVHTDNFSNVISVIHTNISSPDGVAVDWVADNLYWTNTGYRRIEVSRLDGSNRKVLIKDDIQDPRSIAVFPGKGYLYWTDWGEPRIERSLLDGTSRKTIASTELTFPVGLTIDYKAKRLYWIDAKLKSEIIEHTDLHGRNRLQLNLQNIHPFSLTQFKGNIYWTDWQEKSVFRAEKINGKEQVYVRAGLKAAMGIVMVAKERQQDWNPCSVDNGGCTHLCLFIKTNYTCACPDDVKGCSTVPKSWVSLDCPSNAPACVTDEDETLEYTNSILPGDDQYLPDEPSTSTITHFYVMTLVPMLVIILLSIVLTAVLLIRKGKKKYLYPTGRSFSNPNYYSSGSDANPAHGNVDRRQFIWRRLKYDKSQERVYEERVRSGSPEVASLIPAILTPSSSNCEAVTPELARSPSVTPSLNSDIVT